MTVSAGTRPVVEINPVVIQAMKEVGIDISKWDAWTIEKAREIRDDIEQRVKQLAADLVKSSPQIKH